MSERQLRIYLPVSVFISGMLVMALEILSSRLTAPYFGNNTFVWACLIGFTLAFLTIGYYLGGRIADRKPHVKTYAWILTAAALYLFPLPFCTGPLQEFLTSRLPIIPALIISITAILGVPGVLLGCVSPFAVRLYATGVEDSGRSAGMVYALSTLGGIIGAILPVILFIPWIGTRFTLIFFNTLLFITALVGLKNFWPLAGAVILVFLGMGFEADRKPLNGKVVFEKETAYALYRVNEDEQGIRRLAVNDARSSYSIYNPNALLVGNYLDHFLLASYFLPPDKTRQIKDILILGLAGGTSVRQFNMTRENLSITGVEVDPALIDMGKKYFCLDAPNLEIITMDARRFIKTTPKKYDMIMLDLFIGDQIPPHLVTVEFFREVKAKLKPGGIVAANFPPHYGDYLPCALKSVFRNAFFIRYVVTASDDEEFNPESFRKNIPLMKPRQLQSLAGDLADKDGEIRPVQMKVSPPTDDKSPLFQVQPGKSM